MRLLEAFGTLPSHLGPRLGPSVLFGQLLQFT
jgi:hypothetical protein